MRFDEVIDQILESLKSDWHILGKDRVALPYSNNYDKAAVYKPNISVTMAWGLSDDKTINESWTSKFPDPTAKINYVDVFFNGSLIYRSPYSIVDGGRHILPLPSIIDKLSISERYSSFIKLLSELDGNINYEENLGRLGLQLTDKLWP